MFVYILHSTEKCKATWVIVHSDLTFLFVCLWHQLFCPDIVNDDSNFCDGFFVSITRAAFLLAGI